MAKKDDMLEREDELAYETPEQDPHAKKLAEKRRKNGTRHQRRQRRRARIFGLLLALLTLAVSALLVVNMFFNIKAIQVQGAGRYSAEVVRTASGLQMDQNIFRFSAADTEQLIVERLPYVQAVKVERKLPGTVLLTITEGGPMGAILDGDYYILIDQNGKVLEDRVELAPEEVPVLLGITAAEVNVGKRAVFEDENKFEIAQEIWSLLEEYGLKGITRVELEDELALQLVYEGSTFIKLGSRTELDYKIQFVSYLISEDKLDSTRNVLDASVPGKVTQRPGEGEESFEYIHGYGVPSDAGKTEEELGYDPELEGAGSRE